MSQSDPLSDMLTRIRNAQSVGKTETLVPASRLHSKVLEVLTGFGYIKGYEPVEEKVGGASFLSVRLKYTSGNPAIVRIKRVSRPGRRIYTKIKSLPKVSNGLGISILSTSRGIMSDSEARSKHVGGEILCEVF